MFALKILYVVVRASREWPNGSLYNSYCFMLVGSCICFFNDRTQVEMFRFKLCSKTPF